MFKETMSETIETGAPSIKYNRGDIRMGQGQGDQRSMRVAAQIWEQMEPQQKVQFGNFEKFYQSGIWREILQQLQMDQQQEAAGQGIASQMPREMMEEQVSMSERIPANTGGRIGFAAGGMDFYTDEEGNYREGAFKEKAKEIGGSYDKFLDFGAGENMVFDLMHKKYQRGLSMEEAIKELEQQWEDSIESGAYTVGQSNIGQLGIKSKDEIREKVMEGWDMVKGPTVDTGIMKAANGGRIRAAFGGDMKEKLMMRETIDTPEGIETLKETDTMKMAGGGERGWKAQMLAQQLVDEKYPGQDLDFYDLPHKEQMEIYNIALDMIDSGGE